MIDIFDVAVFSTLTASVFLMAVVYRAISTPAPKQAPVLKRRTDTVSSSDNSTRSIPVRFDHWFANVLARAGFKIDRITAILLIGCLAFSVAAATFVLELPALVQLLIGVTVFLVGLAFYYISMLRRIRKFNIQFPTSLELLARATRAGENLENALGIAGQSSEQPLKGEFQHCVRQLQLGLPPARVAEDLAERTGSIDVHLFAHTVSIHRSLGGKLADSLERLSTVIRDRAECIAKLKSVTGMGRFAVAAIVTMGVFILVYMLTVQPEYIAKLSASSLGQKLIAYAVVSEIVGVVWVAWTLKTEF